MLAVVLPLVAGLKAGLNVTDQGQVPWGSCHSANYIGVDILFHSELD